MHGQQNIKTLRTIHLHTNFLGNSYNLHTLCQPPKLTEFFCYMSDTSSSIRVWNFQLIYMHSTNCSSLPLFS